MVLQGRVSAPLLLGTSPNSPPQLERSFHFYFEVRKLPLRPLLCLDLSRKELPGFAPGLIPTPESDSSKSSGSYLKQLGVKPVVAL